MAVLRNLVAGAWREPAGAGTLVHDAVTGTELTRVSSDGVDLAAVLDHGRAGGEHLPARTFHERAAHLKPSPPTCESTATNATSSPRPPEPPATDGAFDVDGGIGVLFNYSSKGRRERPDDTVHMDGAPERPSRGGTFLGQHLIQLIAEPGQLVDDAVQLVCGDLLDHLTEQDVLPVTGSASTAQRLRAHPTVLSRAVRFTAEADSLNCSVLGPDADPDTPEFRLFVDQLVTEMTVKAGQKCTAIRRALVPADRIDAVAKAATELLSRITVGDPRRSEVDMGALASVEQREEVRRALKALQEAGQLVHGDHTIPTCSAPTRSTVRSSHPHCCAATTPISASRTRSRRSDRSAP